jgi:short-subunit dehydrogenase
VNFGDHRCVVTGASSGIGRALALALSSEGGHVWAIGRSEERLESLVEESAAGSGDISAVQADLEDDADLERTTAEILAAAPDVHVLVHAAGALALGAFESLSASEVDRLLRVNLRAPVLLTQALLPALRNVGGQVVFMNSLAADGASANNAVYAATKRGLTGVADGLRAEVNAAGMRVMSAYVGRTATPMQVWMHEQEGRPFRSELLLQTDDVVRAVLNALAMPRTGEIIDVRLRPSAKLPPL